MWTARKVAETTGAQLIRGEKKTEIEYRTKGAYADRLNINGIDENSHLTTLLNDDRFYWGFTLCRYCVHSIYDIESLYDTSENNMLSI